MTDRRFIHSEQDHILSSMHPVTYPYAPIHPGRYPLPPMNAYGSFDPTSADLGSHQPISDMNRGGVIHNTPPRQNTNQQNSKDQQQHQSNNNQSSANQGSNTNSDQQQQQQNSSNTNTTSQSSQQQNVLSTDQTNSSNNPQSPHQYSMANFSGLYYGNPYPINQYGYPLNQSTPYSPYGPRIGYPVPHFKPPYSNLTPSPYPPSPGTPPHLHPGNMNNLPTTYDGQETQQFQNQLSHHDQSQKQSNQQQTNNSQMKQNQSQSDQSQQNTNQSQQNVPKQNQQNFLFNYTPQN